MFKSRCPLFFLQEKGGKKLNNERSKKWQLTENNHAYTKDEAVERLSSIGEAVYCVVACEIGESGTKHIHAFVVFKNAICLKSLKKHFPRAHFEKCRGSNAINRDYVIKDDVDYLEIGELPLIVNEERENVASEVSRLVINGRSPIDILCEYPRYADYVVRNFRNLNEIFEKAKTILRRKR